MARAPRCETIEPATLLSAGMCADWWPGRPGVVVCCELCGGPAAVHCEADAAFLCGACDTKVHGANFLASRHRRTRVAGAVTAAREAKEGRDDESWTSSASSSCLSTADSATTTTATRRRRRLPRGRRRSPKRRAQGEKVLEGWAKRMGLAAGAARRGAAAAGHALRTCCRNVAMARVPLRVAMAAALWREVATAGASQGGTLQRLEACSHVPARLVVAVASLMGARTREEAGCVDVEEGWDECS